MFRFRRRNSAYYSRRYYRKQRRLGASLLSLLLLIFLGLILCEVLARTAVSVSGKGDELARYQGEPAIAAAYRLQFLTENRQPIAGLASRGRLQAKRSLPVGYQLVGNQQSEFWQIDEQGFRNNHSVPLNKPQGEIRVFLLGGSTAFGQWNQTNENTISSKLEALLQQRLEQQKASPQNFRPNVLPSDNSRAKILTLPPKLRQGQYRVVNAAVPGYASGNEWAQMALQILPYQPDALVVLDGYTDLMLSSSKAQTDIPQVEIFLENPLQHVWASLQLAFQQGLKHLYLVKALNYWVLHPQPSVAQTSLVIREPSSLFPYLPNNENELEQRVSRYSFNHRQMSSLCFGAKIPLLIAVQPEITGRSVQTLAPSEQAILNQLGEAYVKRISKDYLKLIEAAQRLAADFPQIKVLDLYSQQQNFPSPTFTDAIHLTSEANSAVAQRLYEAIAAIKTLQVIPAEPTQASL